MDKAKFMEEYQSCSLADLELIRNTQQEDYSPEELMVLETLIEEKKTAQIEEAKKKSYTVHCVISLLIPVVGIVIGILLLTGQSPEKKAAGKRCLVAAVISVFLFLFMLNGGFSSIF